jgi:hypothetical protein
MVGAANRLAGMMRSTPGRGAQTPGAALPTATPPPPMAPNNQAGFARARDGSARSRLLNSIGIGRTRTAPIQTGFGPQVDAMVQKSPTLCIQLNHIRERGFTMRMGPLNGGSYCDSRTNEIVIGQVTPALTATNIMQILAHEVGHAVNYSNGFKLDLTSLGNYNITAGLDEGVAILNEHMVAAELNKSGLTSYTPMHPSDTKKEIFKEYQKTGNQIKAILEFGADLVMSNSLASKPHPDGHLESYMQYWTRGFNEVAPGYQYHPEFAKRGNPDPRTLLALSESGPNVAYPHLNCSP